MLVASEAAKLRQDNATRVAAEVKKMQLEAETQLKALRTANDELVAADDAAGRVTAAAVAARNPSPHYRASAMDGLALRSADTRGAGDAPVVLARWSNAAAEPPHGEPWCLPVDTGSALPDWADAVLRIVLDDRLGAEAARTLAGLPWRSVRYVNQLAHQMDDGMIPLWQCNM